MVILWKQQEPSGNWYVCYVCVPRAVLCVYWWCCLLVVVVFVVVALSFVLAPSSPVSRFCFLFQIISEHLLPHEQKTINPSKIGLSLSLARSYALSTVSSSFVFSCSSFLIFLSL
jgi:hypothetical protein